MRRFADILARFRRRRPGGRVRPGPPARPSDRLAFDLDVSESSPVVVGTYVTVDHVVSLVVAGRTWADILRAHPELTAADIRACLVYDIEQGDKT